MTQIAEIIKRFREKKHLTIQGMASLCDMSSDTVNDIERCDVKPNEDALDHLSRGMKIPFEILKFLSVDEEELEEEKLKIFKALQPELGQYLIKLFV